MNTEERLMIATERMGTFSDRLRELSNVMNVVYWYKNEEDKNKQKWEATTDFKSAKARKAEIENQQIRNTFVIPKDETLEEFLKDFVDIYAPKQWGLSVYDSNTSLIDNYINPIIGI